MQNEAVVVRGRSCVISSQLVKQYDQDTSFLKGSKLHIAFVREFVSELRFNENLTRKKLDF